MDTTVEIRNPLVSRVQQSIDITKDESGRFHVTVKEGHDFGAALLIRALKALPEGAPFTLDTRPCGGIDESIAAVIISRQLFGDKILLTTEAGIQRLSTMRFVTVTPDGIPHAVPGFSWQVETNSSNQPTSTRPAIQILNKLASYIEELEKPREHPTLQVPRLEDLISVDCKDDTVKVTVIAPIRGDHVQLLQDYLQSNHTDKHVVVDLKDLGADSISGGHCVLMAAKLRKKAGARPLQLENVPSSLARVFNPAYSQTLGFAISNT